MTIKITNYDRLRKLKLPTHITPELAYLCGVLAGDGSITYRKEHNEYCINCVGNPKDEKIFYHQIIAPLFKKVFGITLRIKYHHKHTTYGFSLYSKSIYLYFTQKIGLPTGVKHDTLHVPPRFLQKKTLTRAYLRGVFDTDGCISFKKKYQTKPYYPVITLASKSAPFIKEINNLLHKEGLHGAIVLNYHKRDPRAKRGYTQISSIDLNGTKNLFLWMNQIGFWSPKHLLKIRNWEEKNSEG